MHRKAVFALAGVFLAVAIIVPTVLFILQAQNDLVIIQNPAGMQTGNATTTIPTSQVEQNHANTLIIVAVIEVVFGLLFVVTMYYGINHVHPTH
jgi:uncharacterized BrkB/YihY/UPF0761 family membrane protein